jgi:SAM-dependent methyltransferase
VTGVQIEIAGGDTATPANLAKRMGIVMRYIPAGDARVLDCGCGGGDYVRAFRRQGLAAFGVEFQAPKLDGPGAGGCVMRGDLASLSLARASVDVALLNEVLEHVPSDGEVLAEVRRVLRPSGTLVVMSPNRWFPFESHGVYLRRSGRAVPPYVPLVPYVPLPLGRRVLRYWARNYWPRQLRRLVVEAGFRVVDTGFVWQTFEGISGDRSRVLDAARPALRAVSGLLERTPGLRRFGVSQLVVAVPTVR